MSWLFRYLESSVGKKQVVALTGLAMALFLVAHLAGNLLVFLGPEKFNQYSHALITNPAIYLAEAGLVAIFVAHIAFTARLTLENRQARPQGYAVVKSRGGPSRRTFASQTMIYSGALVAVFTILHLFTFKFGEHRVATYGGIEMRDLHWLVVKVFKNPLYVGWYLLAMAVLGLHLSHGLVSTFTTFGVENPSWERAIRWGSRALAWAIAIGFALIPLAIALSDMRSRS